MMFAWHPGRSRVWEAWYSFCPCLTAIPEVWDLLGDLLRTCVHVEKLLHDCVVLLSTPFFVCCCFFFFSLSLSLSLSPLSHQLHNDREVWVATVVGQACHDLELLVLTIPICRYLRSTPSSPCLSFSFAPLSRRRVPCDAENGESWDQKGILVEQIVAITDPPPQRMPTSQAY